jgi:3'(2'), 5'-bisphosphate nucleotidase
MEIAQLVDQAIHASLLAGEKIMKVYASDDFEISPKDDLSPLTKADRDAHLQILNILEPTQIPILSEEGTHLNYAERKLWKTFWLVDPLDGTKEFISRNDEFTVNIALIHNCQPIAGVIYVPVTRVLYAGIPGIGAYKLLNPNMNCTFQTMQLSGTKLPEETKQNEFVVVTSRSHKNQETEAFIENLRKKQDVIQVISKGSSLKICMVAEGTANMYPKLGPTMEWDTAAGHAIVKSSGKNVYQTDQKTELHYNKENLMNPHFIVL